VKLTCQDRYGSFIANTTHVTAKNKLIVLTADSSLTTTPSRFVQLWQPPSN